MFIDIYNDNNNLYSWKNTLQIMAKNKQHIPNLRMPVETGIIVYIYTYIHNYIYNIMINLNGIIHQC